MQHIISFHFFVFEIQSTSGSHDQTGNAHFLTMPIQKLFDQLLIYVNLYQHAKNQAILFIFSGDMIDCKILQSDWLKTFLPISQEQKFSHIWDLCRNTANNISFPHRLNSVKTNDQLFQ